MSAWPGKYVIGLTGNIATGKSVIRKMLEHLGAYGIDADALAHRTIAHGAPGYPAVVDTFGKWVVGPDGQIQRARLARIVFSDPEALALLEAIVHPLVGQAVDILVRRARQKVVVIEAIKLIEAGLDKKCDSLWVSAASRQVQVSRLVSRRGMTEEAALARIDAQPPQAAKIAAADVVIRNEGSFEATWRAVNAAWEKLFPSLRPAPAAQLGRKGELSVQRARPQQAGDIARLMTRLSGGHRSISRAQVMEAFGEKAFLLLLMDEKPVGLAGWKVENLVACTDEVYLEPGLSFTDALRVLMNEVERASQELQCEVSLLFLPAELARQEALLRTLGYQVRSVQSLGVRAWQEAAQESVETGSALLFKQLRQDRVLRPV